MPGNYFTGSFSRTRLMADTDTLRGWTHIADLEHRIHWVSEGDNFAEAFVTLGLTEIFKGHEGLPLGTSLQVARRVLRDAPLLTPNVPPGLSQGIILTDGEARSACRFAQRILDQRLSITLCGTCHRPDANCPDAYPYEFLPFCRHCKR